MKKNIFVLLIFLSLAFNINAEWHIQGSPTIKNLNSVFMVNPSTGWIVGDGGTILKYNGTSWIAQNSGTTKNLTSVHFVDATHGWAVGDTGTILVTTDGNNWISQQSNTTMTLNDIFFTDETTGWAVGAKNTVIRTIDGINWGIVDIPKSVAAGCDSLKTFMSVHFNGSTGIIVGGNGCGGGGAVFISSNNGDNWEFNTTGINYSSEMNSGYVISSTNIWLTSYAKGSSGLHQFNGSTWTEKTISGAAMRPNTLFFKTESDGYLIDGNGKIFNYNGDSWTNVCDINSNQLNSIKFIDSEYGWAVGNNGTIISTLDPPVTINEEVISSEPNPDGIVSLTWIVAADSLNVVRYDIYLDNVYIGSTTSNSFDIDIDGGTLLKRAAITHIIEIKALDVNNAVVAMYEPVSVNSGVSVLQPTANNNLIYPNPTSGKIKIKSTENIGLVSIMNIQGQIILQTRPHAVEASIHLDKTIAPAGTYLVKIATSKGVSTQKIQIIK
jgi:photosystem II stability/assembly factor-like uncharacterized protein